jgi:hypothetical protein
VRGAIETWGATGVAEAREDDRGTIIETSGAAGEAKSKEDDRGAIDTSGAARGGKKDVISARGAIETLDGAGAAVAGEDEGTTIERVGPRVMC